MSISRAHRDRRGVAALEFALVMPVLVVLVMSLYDVSNAVITWWRLAAAAAAIAHIATVQAATPTNTNVLSTSQAAAAGSAVFAVIPSLRSGPATVYSVTLTSVVMTATLQGCASNCTYVANVAWSQVVQGSGLPRACGQLVSTSDGSPSAPISLPIDTFTASPLLVVDVSYQFAPLFKAVFSNTLTFTQSAYVAMRTGPDSAWMQLTGPQAAQSQCPGYTG